MEFNKCISNYWCAQTYAVSEKKAMSNFKYQYKKLYNKITNTKIELPGKIAVLD